MAHEAKREPARDPQDLERLLVSREWAGDVEGMVALYAPDAVIDCGGGRLVRGLDDIRALFAGLVAQGARFAVGVQSPATISGDLALTSTRLPDGRVTAEVGRRQSDGTWLWVIDRFCVARTTG
jgi:ketosteroid isomerase-like protein